MSRYLIKRFRLGYRKRPCFIVSIIMTSYWARWRLESPASRLFSQPFIQGADQRKKSKLRVTGLSEGNSPVPGEFPAQRASNAENASIWWRHHAPNEFNVLVYGGSKYTSTAPNVFISNFLGSFMLIIGSSTVWGSKSKAELSSVESVVMETPRHVLVAT